MHQTCTTFVSRLQLHLVTHEQTEMLAGKFCLISHSGFFFTTIRSSAISGLYAYIYFRCQTIWKAGKTTVQWDSWLIHSAMDTRDRYVMVPASQILFHFNKFTLCRFHSTYMSAQLYPVQWASQPANEPTVNRHAIHILSKVNIWCIPGNINS